MANYSAALREYLKLLAPTWLGYSGTEGSDPWGDEGTDGSDPWGDEY